MLHAQCAAFHGPRAYTDDDAEAQQAGQTFNGLPEGLTRSGLAGLVKHNRTWMGLTRTLASHLEFLVLHTQDQDWETGQKPIVWMSVDTTAGEMKISARQVERRERALNAAGAIAWNDSANHKRFGWREGDGYIVEAYGVDLSPIGAMAGDLLEEERRRKAELGERGLCTRERRKALAARRSVKAMLARAVLEGLVDPETQEWRDKTEILGRGIPPRTPLGGLRDLNARFRLLTDELKSLLRPVQSNVPGTKEARTEPSERPEPKRGKTVKMSPWGDMNVAHIDNTNLESTDKSVTSTPACGQGTSCGGEADAPKGAKSSMKTVDGRKNEEGGAAGSQTESAGRGQCAVGGWRELPDEVPSANFDAGESHRESPKPVVVDEGRERDERARGDESRHCGVTTDDPGLHSGHPKKGGLWKPDTGTRHLSPLNVVETAGPRMLAAVSRANRAAETDRPDWGEIEDAAEGLCPQLGIGLQVWCVAVTVMGRRAAAICVMLIDRKMCPDAENPVRCPGAYLRGMTDRARHDKLHLHASVFGWGRRIAA